MSATSSAAANKRYRDREPDGHTEYVAYHAYEERKSLREEKVSGTVSPGPPGLVHGRTMACRQRRPASATLPLFTAPDAWRSAYITPAYLKANMYSSEANHVFISYCRDDKDAISRLRQRIVDGGFAVWWDDDILPGEDWKHAIRVAMSNAFAVIICLSRNLNRRNRSGMYPEMSDAIAILRQTAPGKIFAIPVRLDKCTVPQLEIDDTRTLDRLQYIDLFPQRVYPAGIQKLLAALRAASPEPPQTHQANSVSTTPKTRVVVQLNIDYEKFDKRAKNTLIQGISGFLDIPIDEVNIVSIEEGSVRVILEIPEHLLQKLLLFRNEPAFRQRLPDLELLDISGGLPPVFTIRAEIGHYSIGMDGRWTLETLSNFARLYSQLYSVAYALHVQRDPAVNGQIRHTLQSYPWRGGYSRLNFYTALRHAVPQQVHPQINSILYSSPGTMVLSVIADVAKMISVSGAALADPQNRTNEVYKRIDQELAKRGLRRTKIGGGSDDTSENTIDDSALTETNLDFVATSTIELAEAMRFSGIDRLLILTGNRLTALKILMSYYRRLRDLVSLSTEGYVQI